MVYCLFAVNGFSYFYASKYVYELSVMRVISNMQAYDAFVS